MALTPPHLAQLELTYVTPERVDDYFVATLRGFHEDYNAELWGPGRGVFEPERHFGYSVDGRWVSSCGAYSRVMTVPGGTVPVAAVTFVTVSPAYRRRGLLREMMTHQLADIVRRGEPVALLWASESSIYGRFGYGPTTSKLKTSGPTRELGFRTDVDLGGGSVGAVEAGEFAAVVPGLHRALLGERPGALDRNEEWWAVALQDPEPWRHGATAFRFALHYDMDGEPDGYLTYRIANGGPHNGAEVVVSAIEAASPAAYARLWRFVLDLDLVSSFRRDDGPVEEPLRLLVADPRQITAELSDGTYARIVDLRAALAARTYAADLDVVIEVRDALIPTNDGVFRLTADGSGAQVTKARRRPDVTLDIRELGAIYLGGTSLTSLHTAGLVTERTPGTVAAITAAFTAPRAPFCPDFF